MEILDISIKQHPALLIAFGGGSHVFNVVRTVKL